MKLLDIKSRERRPVTVQMPGHVHNRVGTRVARDVKVRDRVSGEFRVKTVERKFPPVIRWGAGETVPGLPASVRTDDSVIPSMLRRRRLVVVKEYDAPELPPISAAQPPARKRARRTKATQE